MKPLNGPSIIIVIEGRGYFEESKFNQQINISAGTTVFCSASYSLTINKGNTKLLMFQAYVL